MQLDIIPNKGIGDIAFGMSKEDIESSLGPADNVETIDNAADEPTTVMHYDKPGLTIFLEGEPRSLSCIDIADERCLLFGEEVFSLTERKIVELMVANGFLEQDASQEDWGERRISFPQANIDFYFDEGELVSIILGL